MNKNFVLLLICNYIILSLLNAKPTLTFISKEFNQFTPRIAHGSAAKLGEFPHQVALLKKVGLFSYSQFCGGTIIEDQVILTAAHCVEDFSDASSLYISAGFVNLNEMSSVVKVNSFKMHPNYNTQTVNNDVALLFLKSKLTFNSNIKKAVLEDKEISSGTKLWVTGWGKLETEQSSDVLMKIEVPTTNGLECKQVSYHYSSTTMMCAGDGLGGDACGGDSGGPFGSKTDGGFRVAGIVSWGPQACGEKGSYGAYAKVSNYIPWITATMNGTQWNSKSSLFNKSSVFTVMCFVSITFLVILNIF